MDMYQLGKRGEGERCTIRADARGSCPGLGRGDQDEWGRQLQRHHRGKVPRASRVRDCLYSTAGQGTRRMRRGEDRPLKGRQVEKILLRSQWQ